MNLIETLSGIAVMTVFVASLSALAIPLARSLESSRLMYERAKMIEFLDRSFRSECSADHPDIDRWKRDVAASGYPRSDDPRSDDLRSCDVIPCRSGGVVRAMRAVCVIGDNRVELLAEYGHE